MNRNKITGGIKFRELDHSKNSPDKKQSNSCQLRSKEAVLKLFNESDKNDNVQKENKIINIPAEEINLDENFDDDFDEVMKEPEKQINENVAKQQVGIKLNIIREKPKIQSNIVDSSSKTVSSEINPNDKRIFNVMVGKISTRKHKQWESDGILEVNGKSAVLKDINGKFMGRTTVKPETIEEGFRLCIGGKEIEIVELASQECIQASQTTSQTTKNECSEPPTKKAKVSKAFVPVKSGTKK